MLLRILTDSLASAGAPHADQHSQTSSSLLGQEAASSKEEFSASAAEAALQTPTSR